MNEVKVLFITRNYPPQIGGMEKYSYDLYHSIKKDINIDILKNSKGKLYLPFFVARCLVFILIRGNQYTHIHFGDAVLAPLGYISKSLLNAKISITVHALDVIFDNRLYQSIIPVCLASLDKVVSVSRYTLQQCVLRGVDKDRCYLIPNGITIPEFDTSIPALETISKKYGINTAGKKILFSIGRLIRRKGISWFVEHVMPGLGHDYIYLIAGDGPELKTVADIVRRRGLEARVYLLGPIPDSEKFCLYLNSELYIMPNISIPGDAEGFGITIIEAAAFGLPAIAANIEGIPDTITDGVTGTLVQQRNEKQFVDAIVGAMFDKSRIRKLTRVKYDWSVLSAEYIRLIFC